jgi:hypothetical protein
MGLREEWGQVVIGGEGKVAQLKKIMNPYTLKHGRGGPTNSKPAQYHDFIEVPSLSIEGISSRAAEF